MEKPNPHECGLWRKVHATLKEAGKTNTSYFQMAEEALRLCDPPGRRGDAQVLQ